MTMASLILGAPPIYASPLDISSSYRSESRGISLSCSASLLPLSASSPSPVPFVYCGRGDKKTAKGKRSNHSFGNARPRDEKKGRGPPRAPVPPLQAPWKDKFDDYEKIKIEIDEALFSS